MTVTEFSNEFDILYDNISTNKAPNIDAYEKSVYLTKAQLEIVKNHFSPNGNKYGEGFDDSQKRQVDFLNLITVTELEVADNTVLATMSRFDDKSDCFLVPNNVLFIINETARGEISTLDIGNNYSETISKAVNIVPITFTEYATNMMTPFKVPYKNQGWRLINNSLNYNVFEVITEPTLVISEYMIRYVKTPTPIILVDLSDEYGDEKLSIDGATEISECILDHSIHPEILQRAVELAKASYEGNLNTIIEMGKRSE